MRPVPIRWVVMGVFVLSSSLNYLDRQILAALAPLLKDEFRLTNADYGGVLAAFSITYAAFSPVAGLLIDRFGLNRGISFGVALWSIAGIATGFAQGLWGLLGCRALLGAAEASGIPASAKAFHQYLQPRERAFGPAVNQIGLSLGAIAAPPLATWLALRYGWRWAFVGAGILGFLWIPLWLGVAKKAPVMEERRGDSPIPVSSMLRDARLWGFVAANILSMTVYTLWSNWTTLFLQTSHGLSLAQANWLAPVPLFFAYLGGLFGGWLSLRWMNGGLDALPARMRACLVSAVALLATAAAGWTPTALLTTAAISISFFWITAFSVNLYTMPLDAYGLERAAFGVSMLTAAYGVMQAVFSPWIGTLIDRYGYKPAILLVSVTPLAAYAALRLTQRDGARWAEKPQS